MFERVPVQPKAPNSSIDNTTNLSYCRFDMVQREYIGRGAGSNPPNRFEEIRVELPTEDLAPYFDIPDFPSRIPTRFYADLSKSILAKNDSPDVGFTYSLNPYRGCEHGCIYCYARPSHEYLGFSSAQDFESKIMVKRNVARLLEEEFLSPS